MIGFEILVKVSRDKRHEFLQTCALWAKAEGKNQGRLNQALYEKADDANTFLWAETWEESDKMEAYLKSNQFRLILGAISVLGENYKLLRGQWDEVPFK